MKPSLAVIEEIIRWVGPVFGVAGYSISPPPSGGMRYWRFVGFDVPSVAVWATAIGLVGYLFGENLELVDTILSRFGWIMLGLLAAIVGAIVFLCRRRRS